MILLSHGPEPCASANSAIPANNMFIIYIAYKFVNIYLKNWDYKKVTKFLKIFIITIVKWVKIV